MPRTFSLCALALILSRASATNLFQCDVSAFYAGFNAASFSTVASLKAALRTYIDGQQVISYSSTTDPLRDLDAISDTQVRGVYSLLPIDKSDYPNGWNKEHAWPRSRGVGDTGPDTSDLFNLFVADMSLNSARGNKYYDVCTLGVNNCVSPAGTSTKNAAAGSMEDTDTWGPPPSVRGDLARAAFYMAVRYDGSETNTVDLELADCRTDTTCPTNSFGRLSTLVQWHHDDPVSAEELARVNKICTTYQGTRNPFVDFPQLVDVIFAGAPLPSGTPAPSPMPTTKAPTTKSPTTGSTTPAPSPFPTPFPANAPSSWTCNTAYYNAADGCDCACGDADPDCQLPDQDLYGCASGRVCVNGVCSTVPSGWTCNSAYYAAVDGCDCNCGVPDPDCDISGQKLYGCSSGQVCVAGVCKAASLRQLFQFEYPGDPKAFQRSTYPAKP